MRSAQWPLLRWLLSQSWEGFAIDLGFSESWEGGSKEAAEAIDFLPAVPGACPTNWLQECSDFQPLPGSALVEILQSWYCGQATACCCIDYDEDLTLVERENGESLPILVF